MLLLQKSYIREHHLGLYLLFRYLMLHMSKKSVKLGTLEKLSGSCQSQNMHRVSVLYYSKLSNHQECFSLLI
jgi:hypothetical protein